MREEQFLYLQKLHNELMEEIKDVKDEITELKYERSNNFPLIIIILSIANALCCIYSILKTIYA